MKNFTLIILLLFLPTLVQASSIDAKTLFTLIKERQGLESWASKNVEMQVSKLKSQSQWENPQIQLGFGSAVVGSFKGGYNEVTISQVIPLNGEKKSKADMIPYKKNIATIEGRDFLNQSSAHILLMIYSYLYNSERAEHSLERKKRMALVQTFLEKRKAISPKDKVERMLIENRIRYLEIEIEQIKRDLEQAQDFFSLYLNKNEIEKIKLNWPDVYKIQLKFQERLQNADEINRLYTNKFKINELELKAAKSSWIPDLKFYYTRNKQDQFMQLPNVNDAFGLGLSLPLFNIQRSVVLEKKSQLELSKIAKNKLDLDRISQLSTLKNKMHISGTILKKFNEKYIYELDNQLSITGEYFKKGLVPVANFLDLEEQVHMSIHMFSKAKLDIIEFYLECLSLNALPLDFDEVIK